MRGNDEMALLISSVGSLVVPLRLTRSDNVLRVEFNKFKVSDASSNASIAALEGLYCVLCSARSLGLRVCSSGCSNDSSGFCCNIRKEVFATDRSSALLEIA